MQPKKLDPQRVVLVPADEGAVALGFGAATTPGGLQAQLTVNTAELGQFTVLLSARQLALLAAVSKQLLTLNPHQIEELRNELFRHDEGNN